MNCVIKKDTNLCQIKNCIIDVSGMDSNSVSPSDTWFLQFNNTFYKNEYFLNENTKIEKGFLKLFLSIDDNLIKEVNKEASKETIKDTRKRSLYGLSYEIDVYKEVISKFLDLKICVNFVNFLSATRTCTYENLISFLKNNVVVKGEKLSQIEIENSLKNTIYQCFINSCEKRKNIARNEKIEKVPFDPRKYNYSVILVESIPKNTMTFTKWLILNYSKHNYEFWNILFQITAACYTMSLSKMNHNDLHASNIFIQELNEPEVFIYYMNDIKYKILTKFKVLIFDFDRSYVEFLGENKFLKGSLCKKNQQCNEFIENKDIIKLFCYIFKRYFLDERNEDVKKELLNIISENEKVQNDILEIYKDCLLTYFFNNSVDVNIFKKCSSILEILQNIYEKIENEEVEEVVKKNYKKKYIKNVSVCNSSCFFENGEINVSKSIRCYKEIIKEIEIDKNEKKVKIINPDIPNLQGYTTEEILDILKIESF